MTDQVLAGGKEVSLNRAPGPLVSIEGPAGTGKSTLSLKLSYHLKNKGIQTGHLPEFSATPLGKALAIHSEYGTETPPWCLGIGGLLAFIADKVQQLESMHSEYTILVSDRFITSQMILGIRSLRADADREFGETLVRQICAWAERRFAIDGLMVILNGPSELLRS